jgi:hypothetical protein
VSSSSESTECKTGDSRIAVELTWAFLSRWEACSHNSGQEVLTLTRIAVQLEKIAEVGWVAKYSISRPTNHPSIPQDISRPPEILHDFSKLKIYNYCYVKNSSLSYTPDKGKWWYKWGYRGIFVHPKKRGHTSNCNLSGSTRIR